MDPEELEEEWKTDPGLVKLRFKDVGELRAHLLGVHAYLIDPERSGPSGYLYRQQIKRLRQLKDSLK